MQISLNKANKILQKLRSIRGIKISAVVSLSTQPSMLAGPVPELLQGLIADQQKKNAQALAIKRDILTVKEALFARNQALGISLRMNRLELLRHRVETHQGMLKQLDQSLQLADITPDYIGTLRSLSEQKPYTQDLLVRLIEREELDALIQSDSQEINRIEDELQALNSRETIDLELTSESMELLGMI